MMKNIFDFRGDVQIRVSIKRRRATWAVCTLPYVSQQGMQELRWREIRAPKRIQQAAQQQQCGYIYVYTSEADFHKSGVYGGSVRVWAAAWDVFRRAPSRVGRGGRAAVDFMACFGLGGFASFFSPPVFIEARTKERSDRGRFFPLRQKSLFIMRQGRGSEATEAVFCL